MFEIDGIIRNYSILKSKFFFRLGNSKCYYAELLIVSKVEELKINSN
jgi:hypothetical protein